MGNVSGADDLLLLEDGALISGSGAWLDHAAVRIDGGTLILPNGRERAVTENGSLIQNGGEIR